MLRLSLNIIAERMVTAEIEAAFVAFTKPGLGEYEKPTCMKKLNNPELVPSTINKGMSDFANLRENFFNLVSE